MTHLLISVRLHDGRYHGAGDWPPSPARLFQALVAGAAQGAVIAPDDSRALLWLESLRPPTIACPLARPGQQFENFVPNNDLDAVGGDIRQVESIRTRKAIRPRLFDASIPLLYIWTFEGDPAEARKLCQMAERLYQLGRGIDMAWACGSVLDDDRIGSMLESYAGSECRPSEAGMGVEIACPCPGTLQSLEERFAAARTRFASTKAPLGTRLLFSQPPKARFRQVAYDSRAKRFLFELRERTAEAAFAPWPLARASSLVVAARDAAAERLRGALPSKLPDIESGLIGRKPTGEGDGPSSARVRILPLPSIGHEYVDRGIRRLLVEVPAMSPLRPDDVEWAFSGIEVVAGNRSASLVRTSHDSMLTTHYGGGEDAGFRIWRTITPAAVPVVPRTAGDRGHGATRVHQELAAIRAVRHALRHAEIRAAAESIRVQRDSFESRGQHAAEFAHGTRFSAERLWHAEVTFAVPLRGPLAIGDGRFLGLGIMAPVKVCRGVHAFFVAGLVGAVEPVLLARALRRAVMARVQEVIGRRARLSRFFSGHDSVEEPAAGGHLAFLYDALRSRLLAIAPHVLERREPYESERNHLANLELALLEFSELRAGSAGLLSLRAQPVDGATDPLFSRTRVWRSLTEFEVTRHRKCADAAAALSEDLRAECQRAGLPRPIVKPLFLAGVPNRGLTGRAELSFEVAVEGPILLGRSRYLGGGVFETVTELVRARRHAT